MLLYQISLPIYSETICAAIFGLSKTITLNMCNSHPFPAYITIHTDYFVSLQHICVNKFNIKLQLKLPLLK